MRNAIAGFFAAAVLFAAAAATGQAPEVKEVTATGVGSILNGDVAHAKDDAVEDALRQALEQTMGLFVSSETLVENAAVIEDNIYSKTQGYIQKYDILREGKKDAETYGVTLSALVKLSDLKSDLDAIQTLLRRKKMPRLMVIIDEKNVGETATAYHYMEADLNTAESQLINKDRKSVV